MFYKKLLNVSPGEKHTNYACVRTHSSFVIVLQKEVSLCETIINEQCFFNLLMYDFFYKIKNLANVIIYFVKLYNVFNNVLGNWKQTWHNSHDLELL